MTDNPLKEFAKGTLDGIIDSTLSVVAAPTVMRRVKDNGRYPDLPSTDPGDLGYKMTTGLGTCPAMGMLASYPTMIIGIVGAVLEQNPVYLAPIITNVISAVYEVIRTERT